MALPDLQEAGHSWAPASAVFGNTHGVPAREYGQLLLQICLGGLLVGGTVFFYSLGTSLPVLDSLIMAMTIPGRKLCGYAENAKITLRFLLT